MKLIDHPLAIRHVTSEMQPRLVRAAEGAGGLLLWMDFSDMGGHVLVVMPAGSPYAGPWTTPHCVHIPVSVEAQQDRFQQFLAGGENEFVRLVCDVHDHYGTDDVLLKDAVAIPGGFVALRLVPDAPCPQVFVVRRFPEFWGKWQCLPVDLTQLQKKFEQSFWGSRLLPEAPHYLAALPYLTAGQNACMNANSYSLNPAPIMMFLSIADENPFRDLMCCNLRPQHIDFSRDYGVSLLNYVAKIPFSADVFDAFGNGRADPLAIDFTLDSPADTALDAGNLPAILAFARASTRRGNEHWWLELVDREEDRRGLTPEVQDLIRSEIARTKAKMAADEISIAIRDACP